MASAPEGKTQLNTYVPFDINDHVEHIKTITGLTKSEAVHLMTAYFRKFMSDNDLIELAEQMRVFGEVGLERVC